MHPAILATLIISLSTLPTFAQDDRKEFTNSIGMRMKPIPMGSFAMGSPVTEKNREDHEVVHQVTLSSDFYLGVYEVTQAQYEKVMGKNPSYFQDLRIQGDNSNHPVEYVYRSEAVDFCKRLSELPEEKAAGRVYRLPTEAEWEYACRAGSKTVYGFGDEPSDLNDHAWFANNSGTKRIDADALWDQHRDNPRDYVDAVETAGCVTHPVGLKKPNAWGLYDMHGNVAEWVSDWYAAYPKEPVSDPGRELPLPTEPEGKRAHLIRGGCWYTTAADCRSAARRKVTSSYRDGVIGFRVVMSQPAKP
jgi:formylglycine-generating enzyme required for sulfatase activity